MTSSTGKQIITMHTAQYLKTKIQRDKKIWSINNIYNLRNIFLQICRKLSSETSPRPLFVSLKKLLSKKQTV